MIQHHEIKEFDEKGCRTPSNTKPDGLAETNPILIRITTKVKVAVAVACINELFPKGYIPIIKFNKCVTKLSLSCCCCN